MGVVLTFSYIKGAENFKCYKGKRFGQMVSIHGQVWCIPKEASGKAPA